MGRSRFVDYVVYDLLSGFEGLGARAMFGAHGLYKDGVIFGIVDEDLLYFKVDQTNRKAYEARASKPLTDQSAKGKIVSLPYWEVPVDVMEDREEIQRWAEISYRISVKQGLSKTHPRRRPSPE